MLAGREQHPRQSGDKENMWPESAHPERGSWAHLSPFCSLTSHLTLLQRFRFCGDLDCPDWVLAEISTLAKIVKCTGLLGVGGRREELGTGSRGSGEMGVGVVESPWWGLHAM